MKERTWIDNIEMFRDLPAQVNYNGKDFDLIIMYIPFPGDIVIGYEAIDLQMLCEFDNIFDDYGFNFAIIKMKQFLIDKKII